MTRHYCCYFDERYMPRGLVMIRSLRRFEPESIVWVLCLTDECHDAMSKLGERGVRLICFSDFEAGDAALATARANRSVVEYYFTCTPSLVLYVMERAGPDDLITYVDGDLFFFATPAPLHEALDEASVTIIEHRFPGRLRKLEKFGRFNVGWLGFRNDDRARVVATWWRDRCNEWCYDRLEADRFADQKYLDRFASLSEGVAIIDHPGANLAPWNLGRHRLSERDGCVLVDGRSLIFFHFHGFKRVGETLFVAEHHVYRAPFGGLVRRRVYRPYVDALLRVSDEVRPLIAASPASLTRDHTRRIGLLDRLKNAVARRWRSSAPYLFLNVIAVIRGRAY